MSCIYLYGNERNSRSFTFTYIVELESSNGKKLELWVPLPKSNEVQSISNLNINAEGLSYEVKDEKTHGNKYIYIYSIEGTTINKTISIECDVIRYEHKNIIYADVESKNYLGSTSMVPTGGIFNSIIKDNSLGNDNLRGLYDFVLSGMHYGKPRSSNDEYYKEPWLNSSGKYGTKKVSRDDVVDLYKKAKESNGTYTFGNGNSLYACDIGVGNCTDYHSYFISLSRTMNIPARFHMGFFIPDNQEGNIDGYHCWADYYTEDHGWYPVDISEADKIPERKDYFFGTVCNNRLDMMVGRDFILDGYDNGKLNLFIYPILEIANKVSSNYKKKFSYKNL